MKLLKTTIVKPIVIAILCLLLLPGITSMPQAPETETPEYRIEPPDQAWVDKTLAELTLREKIGQLVHVRVRGEFLNRQSQEFRDLKETIEQCHVGGVVLFAGNIYESALLLNELQSLSNLPLLVSADFERGASFRIADTTSFPWTMAIGATGSEEFAYQEGMITARESRALGVHWLFAPVLDVNNNPKNPVINIRSFGEDPQLVAHLGSAFIRGARSAGALTTAKHFPGHGDTATDTHIGLAVVPSDLDRLNSMELIPFRSAIEAGVDAIMTAHVAVPKVTGESETPATLSKAILTDLLRHTLQFKGLVVTDAMEMGGIKNKYWCGLAAVSAIEAGADIVLLPTDNTVAINEIERAVEMGNISPEQIDRSVEKILKAKSSLGLHRNRTVSLERLGEIVASPQSRAFAQEVADHSITAVKDEKGLLPVDPTENPKIYSLVLDSGLDTSPGYEFRSKMREYYPSMISEWANSRITSEEIRSIQRNAARSDLIVCSTFSRLTSGSNTIGMPQDQQAIIEKLIETGKPILWVAFGNPYVLERFPKVGTYLCTFSYSDVSQIAAAKAISGEIPISGKMPVSIPKLAAVGDGLQLPKLEMVLKSAQDEVKNTSSDTLPNRIKISRKLTSYVESGVLTDACLVVGHKGSFVSIMPSPPLLYYPFQSSSFGTIFAAMLATESGSLLLDAPVKDYLPEFQDTDSGKISISDLLADISGKSQTITKEEISNRVLIEEIVSRTSGLSIDRMLLPILRFIRIGDTVSTFHLGPGDRFTPYDLGVFSQIMLNSGIYDYRRIFKPDTITRFTAPGGNKQTLGWIKPDKSDWTGRMFSSKAFGHIDLNGSFLWIDPQKQLFIVFLTSVKPEASEAVIVEMHEKIAQSVLNEIK